MRRALFICTYGDFAATFEKNNINILQKLGYEVHVASNFADSSKNRNIQVLREMNVQLHHINFERIPFSKQGLKNIKELDRLIKKYQYKEIDCHNPVCGIFGRICGKKNHVPNIIYTAHGFHFFKGAPLKNWLLYFPAEWICSWMTDVLITINKEDYKFAKRYLHAKRTEYIPGVGIDIEKFADCYVDKKKKCKKLGIPDDKFILLSLGELQEKKNQKIVIDVLGKMQNPDIYYLIAGQGDLKKKYEQMIRDYGLEDHIKLLGYRADFGELCEVADCFIHTVSQEDLPVALLEAMASGLPVIGSDARDVRNFIVHNKSGICVNPKSGDEVQDAILKVYFDNIFRKRCGCYNFEAVQKYCIENIGRFMNDKNKIVCSGREKHLITLVKSIKKRKEMGFQNEDFILISVGELNENKNHEIIIRALEGIENEKVKYIICGQGNMRHYLEELIKEKHLEKRVYLLGYRKDIPELLHMSDVFVFPSKREGLPVALLEAMASGLPCLASDIRGNRDLITNRKSGILVEPNDIKCWTEQIRNLQSNKYICRNLGEESKNVVINYSMSSLTATLITNIYLR